MYVTCFDTENNQNTSEIDIILQLQPFSSLMLLRRVEVAMTSACHELYNN